jgi:hypothetical protein
MRRKQPFRHAVSPQTLEDSVDRALHCALYALDVTARRAAVTQSVIEAVRADAPCLEDEQTLQLRLDEAEATIAANESRRNAALARSSAYGPVLVAAAAFAVLFPVWLCLPPMLFAAVLVVCTVGAIGVTRHHLIAAWATLCIARASRTRRWLHERQALCRQVAFETDRAVNLVVSSFDATYEEARSAVVPVHPPSDLDGDILSITRNPAPRARTSEPRSVT